MSKHKSSTMLAIAVVGSGLLLGAAPAGAQQFSTPSQPTYSTPPPPSWQFPSTLYACGQSCNGDLAAHANALSRPIGHLDNPQAFEWYSRSSPAQVLWQVALQPFGDNTNVDAQGLQGQGMVEAGRQQYGVFDLTFAPFIGPNGGGTGPFTFYVRAFPFRDGTRLGPASNTVVFTFAGQGETFTPYVLPQAYDVQIVGFERLRRPTQDWGCMKVDYMPSNMATWQPLWWRAYRNGTLMCPAPYRGIGEPTWYGSLWDFATGALSWVSTAYADLKNEVVNQVANALPGDLCGQGCRDRLTDGMNIGLIALGIPPTLPDMDALLDEGAGYLVEELVTSAGLEGCEYCKEKLREEVDKIADKYLRKQKEHLCNSSYAHDHGSEPLCVPAGIRAHVVPESDFQPARAIVRITRNHQHPELTESDLLNYRLRVRFPVVNNVGSSLWLWTSTCVRDGQWFPCNSQPISIPGPLNSLLFKSRSLDIPVLSPGESLDIPMVLEPTNYWIPDHYAKLRRNGAMMDPVYNDWSILYDGATVNVSAAVSCPGVTFGSNCNVDDTLSVSNLSY